jgi:hypothetical protein
VSVQDLRPNSQDISAFYLANIYQIFADPNVTVPPTSIPSTIAIPPPFSPPRYAVWVNSLWFLSLVISFTCALLAMLLRQWAYRYTRLTQQARRRPEERARIRAFLVHGVDEMHLRRAVEILPALIHIYLFLFFAGLAIFLFNINHSVFVSVIWWIGLALMVYVWVTVMPVLWTRSPCYTPLSSLVWSLHPFLTYALYSALAFITGCFGSPSSWTSTRFDHLSTYYLDRMVKGMWRAAEENALKPSPDIDLRMLNWTMRTVGDDETLEKLFEALPGFFSSPLVKNLKRPLPDLVRSKFVDSFGGFLSRNVTSNSVSEEDKIRRLDICMNGSEAICEPSDMEHIVSRLFLLPFDQLQLSFRTAEILTRWCTQIERRLSSNFTRAVDGIILYVWERDNHWIALVKDKFGMPEDVLQDNIAHGDNSVLLAIVIHMTRLRIETGRSDLWVLSSLSRFDIRNTAPGLQREFCALWNEIVQRSRSEVSWNHLVNVLRAIRKLYIALHQDTDAAPTAFRVDSSTEDLEHVLSQPSLYPLCNIGTHHPASTVPPPTQPIRAIPGDSAAPQQAADDTPPHPQGSPSLSSTTDPVHVPP